MKPRLASRQEIARHVILALIVVTSTLGRCWATRHAGWRTHRSTDYGFTINFPQDFQLYFRGQEGRVSYLPVCASESVACMEYEGNEYDGTNFGAAAVSVNVLRDVNSKDLCDEIDNGARPLKTVIINGIHFKYGEIGEGGLGHGSWGQSYRKFHEDVCFEITLLTTASSIEGDDPGTVKEFDSTKVENVLNQILQTFRFVGHVVAGRNWIVYHSDCDARFEYPKAATVNTPIEYDPMRAYSDGVTCIDTFIYRGLRYIVAAKLNMTTGALEEWLQSRGYPDLTKAHEVRRSDYWTDYQVGPYRYIVGQAKVYILYVSDAQHRIVIPHQNHTYQHFLDSFRPN